LALKEHAQAAASAYKSLRGNSYDLPIGLLHSKIATLLGKAHKDINIDEFMNAIVSTVDGLRMSLSDYSDNANKSFFVSLCRYVFSEPNNPNTVLSQAFRSNEFKRFVEIINSEILIPLNGPSLHGPNLQKMKKTDRKKLKCGYFGNRDPANINSKNALNLTKRTVRRKLSEIPTKRLQDF